MEHILYAVAVAAQTSEPDAEHDVHVLLIWAKTPEVARDLAEVRMKERYIHAQQKWYFDFAVSEPIAYQVITVAIPPPA
jgi:hypothetical protein